MNNNVSINNLNWNVDFNYQYYVNSIISYLKKPIEFVKNITKSKDNCTLFIEKCLQLDSLMNFSLKDLLPKMNIFFHTNPAYEDISIIFSDIEAIIDYLFKEISNIIHEVIQLYMFDKKELYKYNFMEMKKLIKISTSLLEIPINILDNKHDYLTKSINNKKYYDNFLNNKNEFKKIEKIFYSDIYEDEKDQIVQEIANMEF